MVYIFSNNPPKPMDTKEYLTRATKEFQKLLTDFSKDEIKFQDFFERNPWFVPGAKDELSPIGPSGHGPHLNCLITQPNFMGLIERIPDFMWLGYDSMCFTPVIIEIEAPSKKYFRQDGRPTSHFTQAQHQLVEWQTIFARPENVLNFYENFSIPQHLRDLIFQPRYVLIYGRREEFEKDKVLTQKRAKMVGIDQVIMTYDRIKPKSYGNYITCKVKNGKYIAKYLSPTFKIGPHEDEMASIENLVECVDHTRYISRERKQFLKDKIPFCLKYFNAERRGVEVKIQHPSGINFEMDE